MSKFYLYKSHDQDYQGTFFAYCTEKREMLSKNGILFNWERDAKGLLHKNHRFKTAREAIQLFRKHAQKGDVFILDEKRRYVK